MVVIEKKSYLDRFRGSFTNMLRWEQFDQLWDKLRASTDDWYIYALDSMPPAQPAKAEQWREFLDNTAILLRQQHGEDYCGIVYADNPAEPTYIKIYDPNNLGVVCGISDLPPPLPAWVLSLDKPVVVDRNVFATSKRKPWWKTIFTS